MTTPFRHDAPGPSARSWRSAPAWAEVEPLGGRLADLFDGVDRIVIVAAHPDDEALGAAGLCQRATEAGVRLHVVVATHGQHSHPDSPTTSPVDLARIRRAESTHALSQIAPNAQLNFLGLTDGALGGAEEALTRALVEQVGDGRRTLLVTTWRQDGHPDHEAAGRAAATSAYRTGARFLEYPIWLWHWGDPTTAPWNDLRFLRLSDDEIAAKRQAMGAHLSQIAPLSPAPGDETLLSPGFLAHFEGKEEVFIEQSYDDTALEDLHSETADPWGVDSRWYEQRKRELLLSMLPRERFEHGLEVGCSTGALTAALAERCDRLTAVDRSAAALTAARARLEGADGVEGSGNTSVSRLDVPAQWPSGSFDLIVISEVGYFLSPVGIELLADRVNACLGAAAVVVLAHWRHEVDGWPLDGPMVHETLKSRLALPVAATYLDDDVEILVLAEANTLPDPHR